MPYRVLDAGDLGANFLGGAGGLVGELLHFACNHRKTTTGLAGARRLDGGIEREQRGLTRDRLNQLDHDVDLLRGIEQAVDGLVGMAKLRRGAPGGVPCGLDILAGAQHDLAHLARRIRDLAGIDRRGFRRLRGTGDALRHIAIADRQIGGGHADALAGAGEGLRHIADRGLETPRDELPSGLTQPRFGDPAVTIDRDIVGLTERQTHRLRRFAETLHAAVAHRIGNVGKAVTACNAHKSAEQARQTVLRKPPDDQCTERSRSDSRDRAKGRL